MRVWPQQRWSLEVPARTVKVLLFVPQRDNAIIDTEQQHICQKEMQNCKGKC